MTEPVGVTYDRLQFLLVPFGTELKKGKTFVVNHRPEVLFKRGV